VGTYPSVPVIWEETAKVEIYLPAFSPPFVVRAHGAEADPALDSPPFRSGIATGARSLGPPWS